jgi:regulation of enolase protein 1 (concanavalin A-like superfamily)
LSKLRHFDNAGLILHFINSHTGAQDKWIKAGIEFYEGKSYTSIAACDSWSDWSVVPLPVDGYESRPKVTVEAERKGKSLWVYQVVKNGAAEERVPLRELNWVFAEEEQGWEVGVGGYVTRETEGEGKDDLEAEFEDGVVVVILNGM